jgi:hypothetical protein
VNPKDNNMNKEQKIEQNTKHVKSSDGTVYWLERDGKKIMVLEWSDDGYGNWHWDMKESFRIPEWGVTDAMWNSLVECPDPSAKNEPPFRPGDIVEVTCPTMPGLHGISFQVLDVEMRYKREGWYCRVCYNLNGNLPAVPVWHDSLLKLVRRGGE